MKKCVWPIKVVDNFYKFEEELEDALDTIQDEDEILDIKFSSFFDLSQSCSTYVALIIYNKL